MIAPTMVDVWHAEAIIGVFEPWLRAQCISGRQRREIAELVGRARRLAGCVPADAPAQRNRVWVERLPAGRWSPAA